MLSSCHGNRHAGRLAVWGAWPALTACTETGPGTAAWGFVALAFVLASALAFVAGALLARQMAARALREARDAARESASLVEGWHWQTDASSRLMTWQGPGLPAEPDCALFDDAALAARLRAQQPFAGLRVRLAHPLDGSRSWQLHGTPRLDADGRFCGFRGVAQPLDEVEAARAGAAAVAPLLLYACPSGLAVRLVGWGRRLTVLRWAARPLVAVPVAVVAAPSWPVELSSATSAWSCERHAIAVISRITRMIPAGDQPTAP